MFAGHETVSVGGGGVYVTVTENEQLAVCCIGRLGDNRHEPRSHFEAAARRWRRGHRNRRGPSRRRSGVGNGHRTIRSAKKPSCSPDTRPPALSAIGLALWQ